MSLALFLGSILVQYDLGTDRKLRCALVQADNNDVYILSGFAGWREVAVLCGG